MNEKYALISEIDELVERLNVASDAYYGGRDEILSNFEWDEMFDRLSALEQQTGYVPLNSPTARVSFDSSDSGSDNPGGGKEAHEFPALSLAKTKQLPELQKWAGDRPVFLSWKLDGLTLVVTYDRGKLTRILTRGNGIVGTNITYMAGSISGIPLAIPEKGHFVVRGEAVISYTDFNRINDSLGDDEDKYANPRNLASGTLSLDAKNLSIVKERALQFCAFTLIFTERNITDWGERMSLLSEFGFNPVDYERTDAAGLPNSIKRWTQRVESGSFDIPVDGLVIVYADTEYASTGSVTGHHATRAGLAYKWQDTSAQTTLRSIEWSCAASVITPVAVFDPVALEGTTVTRASLCNITEMKRLGIGENDKTELEIIKANKIIPKCIAVPKASGSFAVPEHCPVCGAPTVIHESDSGTETLRCTDPHCAAKKLKKFTRFVSKSGLDIDGLSSESIRDFINAHLVSDYSDLYLLPEHREEICSLEGFGEKSCDNLFAAIEKSRDAEPAALITALSIPLIGSDAAKRLVSTLGWPGVLERAESGDGFSDLDGIGPERSAALTGWFSDSENRQSLESLMKQLRITPVEPKGEKSGTCKDLTFVITGEVHAFKNRDSFKQFVEEQGGKVTGSVSKKTDYLVTNDTDSGSSKNKKAAELGIPVLTEQAFLDKFGTDSVRSSGEQLAF